MGANVAQTNGKGETDERDWRDLKFEAQRSFRVRCSENFERRTSNLPPLTRLAFPARLARMRYLLTGFSGACINT